MKKIVAISLLCFTLHAKSQVLNNVWNNVKNTAQQQYDTLKNAAGSAISNAVSGNNSGQTGLSNDEIINGLKEALSVGSNNSAGSASKVDGYLKNARLFIPFPPEAQEMKAKLVKLGMQKKVTEFETSLNRAAEEAAKKAAPVFLDAIKNMSIQDGMKILKGADTAATQYLRENTSNGLYAQFLPIVKEAVNKVKVTSYWNPLVTKYNKLPGVKKQNPDLNDYVTRRAISGLFLLVADEEAKIRKDPLARVTDILKKVFGWAEKK
jgi:hypothetical protein